MQPRQTDQSRCNNQPFAAFLAIAYGTCHPRHLPKVGQLRPYPRPSAFICGKKTTVARAFSTSQEKAESGSGSPWMSAARGAAGSGRAAWNPFSQRGSAVRPVVNSQAPHHLHQAGPKPQPRHLDEFDAVASPGPVTPASLQVQHPAHTARCRLVEIVRDVN
jgi:hypothetical protein